MLLELRLAWRNIWRHPVRSGLTIAATVFAVALVVFAVGMAAGSHEKMIEDSVRVHAGHLSITGVGYLDHRTLEHFVRYDGAVRELVQGAPEIRGRAPRVNGFGLLSKGSLTKGVAVVGVDPEREPSVSTLPARVRRGRFLEPGRSREIVLGERLARNLRAELGDELLLYSIAYSLETAYELFTVTGVMKLPEPGLDRSLAVISLADAQEFFVYDDRLSEIALLTDDADAAPALAAAMRDRLERSGASSAEVHSWNERMPELEQFILLDDASMVLTLAILVVVVGFGILETLLMSVLERTRELGVVRALGLRRAAVFRIVYFESMVLAGVGLAIGLAIGILVVLYFAENPIALSGDAAGAVELFGIEPVIPTKLKPLNPIGSTLTIFGVAALAALYPALKASRIRPVDALRSW